MSNRYLPLSLTALRVGRVLPVDVWNANGILLLKQGQSIESLEQLRTMAGHRPMMQEQDFLALGPQMRHLLLQSGASRTGPLGQVFKVASPAQLEIADAIPDLHQRLSVLLRQQEQAQQFVEKLNEVVELLENCITKQPDACLFIMVQRLQHDNNRYSAGHAILACMICHQVAQHLDLPSHKRQSLFRAALTMNIGMGGLQDQLAQQKAPPDEFQRRDIAEHPARSTAILRQLGATDELWLTLVADHHETPDGKGYPAGKTELPEESHLLHLADLFAARISPRVTRPGLSPLLAVRNTYLQYGNTVKYVGEAFVKALGLYPPGSYVKLNTGETAVVMRRGRKASEPVALAILNPQGTPITIPPVRDTSQSVLGVVSSIPAEQIKMRLDPGRLLKRVTLQ